MNLELAIPYLERRAGSEAVAAHGPSMTVATMRLTPSRVSLRELFGDLVGAAATLYPRRQLGAPVRNRGRDPQAPRGDLDLGPVFADRPGDAAGHLARRRRPHPRRGLRARLVEHPGLADEAWGDERDPDAVREQVLAQRQRKAAQPELGRAIDRAAGRRGLAVERADQHDLPLPRLDQAGRDLAGH